MSSTPGASIPRTQTYYAIPLISSSLAQAAATVSAGTSADQQGPSNAVDGIATGYPVRPTSEWASGVGVGAEITLGWDSSQNVRAVTLFDRPNLDDQILGGVLTFSDQSTVSVGPLNNDGTATLVAFAPRGTTSVAFTVTSVGTRSRSVGLAEIQVWEKDAPEPQYSGATTLPPGISLTTSGTLTGTPTKAGRYTFQFVVPLPGRNGTTYPMKTHSIDVAEGAVDPTTTQLPTINTTPVTTAPAITTAPTTVTAPSLIAPIWTKASIAPFSYDVHYSDSVSATGNPSVHYGLQGRLPSGIVFDAASGSLTGTPSGGEYDFTITATNSAGSVSQRFTGTVGTPKVSLDLKLETGTTVAGSLAAIQGSGLLPRSSYTVVMRSEPRVIGTGTAASDGSFVGTVTLPADTPAGAHSLTLTAVAPDGKELTAQTWFSVTADGRAAGVSKTGPVAVPSTPATPSAASPTLSSPTASPSTPIVSGEPQAATAGDVQHELALTGSHSSTLAGLSIASILAGLVLVASCKRRQTNSKSRSAI